MSFYNIDISKQYKTKQEIAYDEIKKLIISNELKPDTQLIIRTIAANMNFSEIPIREALKRLISENFVVERGSNLFVAPITKEDFLDLIDVRLGLEKIAIKITTRKMSPEKIDYLEKNLSEMKKFYDKGELEEYDRLHRNFHLSICLMCDVPALKSALTECFEHHERCRQYYNLKSWDTYPSFDAHEKIFEALKSNDADKVEKCLIENRLKAAQRYTEEINKMN